MLTAAVLVAGVATTATAQNPTPAGTTITNTANATYTDSRGNSYDGVTASASVVVGLRSSIDVTPDATTLSPTENTAGTHTFYVTNSGNGTDNVRLTASVANLTGVTFSVNGGAAVSADDLDNGTFSLQVGVANRLTVVVSFTAGASADPDGTVSLTATSEDDDDTADNTRDRDTATLTVDPQVTPVYTVSVTPDNGTATFQQGDVGQYVAFTVTNTGNQTSTFDLTLGAAPAFVTAAGLELRADDGTTVITQTGALAAGANQVVRVYFTIQNNVAQPTAPGLVNNAITLTATHTTQAAATDGGDYDITVNAPTAPATITMAKEAFRDAAFTTAIANNATDPVLPTQTIYYRITVTNTSGTTAVPLVTVTDIIPPQLTYVSASGTGFSVTAPVSTADGASAADRTLTATYANLAAGATVTLTVQVTVK